MAVVTRASFAFACFTFASGACAASDTPPPATDLADGAGAGA